MPRAIPSYGSPTTLPYFSSLDTFRNHSAQPRSLNNHSPQLIPYHERVVKSTNGKLIVCHDFKVRHEKYGSETAESSP